jgi:hypothetical protein
MKKLMLMLAALAGMAVVTTTTTLAAPTDETTITGNMVCAKCTLHETDSCQNVVQVKEDGKTVNYYLEQNDLSKGAHDPICQGAPEKVTVTGTVKEKDGRKVMTASKLEVVKS